MQDTTIGSDSTQIDGSYVPKQPVRIYATAAQLYVARGWTPLPVGLIQAEPEKWQWQPRRKSSPPGGFTGGNGQPITAEQIEAWRAHRFKGACNLALRLDGVVGFDVDGPEGQEILSFYQARIGRLPATFTSTSRGAGSGRRIAVFRIPPDLDVHGAEWALRERHGERGPDGTLRLSLDIIHQHYRYMVAYPSIHPSGEQYLWYDPAGTVCTVPAREAIPELPGAWQQLMVELVQEHIAQRRSGGYVRNGERGFAEDGDRGYTTYTAEGCIRTALEHIRTHPQGDGHHYNGQLYKRACFLFMFAPAFWDEDTAQKAIEGALTGRFGAPDHDDLATVSSARRSVHETFALLPDPYDLLPFDDED